MKPNKVTNKKPNETDAPLNELSIDDLKVRLAIMQQHRQEAQRNENLIKNEILARLNDNIMCSLQSKDEPFGTVNIDDFSINIPKKVKWDQAGLAGLYKEIGEDAHEYIEVEYGVKENSFKSWPTAIKASFMPFRTVTPGSATVTIKTGE